MKFHFLTVITKNYLAWARALNTQLHKHHQDCVLHVFLADELEGAFDPTKEDFILVPLSAFVPATRLSSATYYTAYEFSNSLKALAHTYMLEQVKADKWLYLDSDMFVTGCLSDIFLLLDKAAVVLCPHNLQVNQFSKVGKMELGFLRTGMYNGGLLGLSNSTTTVAFLRWWEERLTYKCLHNQPGLEADQSWLNFVPILFKAVALITDPRINIAYWNIHERSKEVHTPLILHFSGWDWRNPTLLSKHSRQDLPGLGDWSIWAQAYQSLLLQCDIQCTSQYRYSFGSVQYRFQFSRKVIRLYLENHPKPATCFRLSHALVFFFTHKVKRILK